MPKIVTLHRSDEALSAELRSFLDRVVVPALVRKYIEEVTPAEKPLAPASEAAAYSLGQRSPRSARGGITVE